MILNVVMGLVSASPGFDPRHWPRHTGAFNCYFIKVLASCLSGANLYETDV